MSGPQPKIRYVVSHVCSMFGKDSVVEHTRADAEATAQRMRDEGRHRVEIEERVEW